jgi:Xaa-Pro aminopeptidase
VPADRPDPPYHARRDIVREALGGLRIDALIVTHPPNLRYLCGFDGSLGGLLVTPTEWSLVVDGRYITTARERAAASPGLGDLRVELASRSIEEGMAAEWSRAKPAAVGVESAVMTLDRFARLQALIPARFVTTDRVVEAARLIKDEGEIEVMRQAARMLSGAAIGALAAVRPGRSEIEVALDVEVEMRRAGFSRTAFETIVASGGASTTDTA